MVNPQKIVVFQIQVLNRQTALRIKLTRGQGVGMQHLELRKHIVYIYVVEIHFVQFNKYHTHTHTYMVESSTMSNANDKRLFGVVENNICGKKKKKREKRTTRAKSIAYSIISHG